jgi:23S rRNA (uridine2552-2'-O)-methyltransferase
MGKPYRPKDHYFQRAKQRGFRARSAFKLEELVQRFALLRPGARVLDLGAAPGGFLQVIARVVGPSGLAVGVDLVPLRPFSEGWVRTAVVDVLADDAQAQVEALAPGPYDAVLSDMAPKTTGVRGTDEARSLRLAERALELAQALGKPGSSSWRSSSWAGSSSPSAGGCGGVPRGEGGAARGHALGQRRGVPGRARAPGADLLTGPAEPAFAGDAFALGKPASVDRALDVEPGHAHQRPRQRVERRVPSEGVGLEDAHPALAVVGALEARASRSRSSAERRAARRGSRGARPRCG